MRNDLPLKSKGMAPTTAAAARAQPAGQLLIARQGIGFVVNPVAAEQLVRSLAGQHHLHLLGRQLGDEIQGHARRVGQGLIQMVLYLGSASQYSSSLIRWV